MDSLWDKVGALVGAMITALGGFYMYDRQSNHNRLSKIENDMVQNTIDIRVIETKFLDLKEDLEEIKKSQKDVITLLTNQRRRN